MRSIWKYTLAVLLGLTFGAVSQLEAQVIPIQGGSAASALTGSTLAANVTASSLTTFGSSPTLATPVINGLPTGTGIATANTVSTLVARDGSGNFSAGTVTATLVGAAPAGSLTGTINAARMPALTGDCTTTVGTVATTCASLNGGAFTYTVGTWTPVLAGSTTAGSHTYSVQVGSYEQIGRLIVARFSVATTALGGTQAGNWTITGLPFAATATTNDGGKCYISNMAGVTLDASYTVLAGNIPTGGSTMNFTENGSGVAGQSIVVAKFAAATLVVGTCEYHT